MNSCTSTLVNKMGGAKEADASDCPDPLETRIGSGRTSSLWQMIGIRDWKSSTVPMFEFLTQDQL